MAAMKVLLVDSNEELRRGLWNLLSMHRAFQLAAELETTEQALDYVEAHEVDVVFANNLPADVRFTSDGSHLSSILTLHHPDIQAVIYSDSKEPAYWCCRSGCAGYLLTPFDPLELQAVVSRLTYIYDLQQAKREAVNRSIMIKTRNGSPGSAISSLLSAAAGKTASWLRTGRRRCCWGIP